MGRRKKIDIIIDELIEEDEIVIEEENIIDDNEMEDDDLIKLPSTLQKADEKEALLQKEIEIEEDEFEEDEFEEEEVEKLKPESIILPLEEKKEEEPKKILPIDPVLFTQYIMKFYETGVFSNELAEYVYKLGSRLGMLPRFMRYSYLDEMISDAVLKMVLAINNKKFDPSKGNSFSYFTQISFYAFINRIKKEKKRSQFIRDFQEESYHNLIEEGLISSKNVTVNEKNDY